jgi:hypothetical protein
MNEKYSPAMSFGPALQGRKEKFFPSSPDARYAGGPFGTQSRRMKTNDRTIIALLFFPKNHQMLHLHPGNNF